MRLTTRGIVYHPDRTPNLTDTFCFSIAGVTAEEFTDALLDDLVQGQEVALIDPGPGDRSRMIRCGAAGFQTRRICHGSFNDSWHDATREQALEWALPCAKLMLRLKSADGYLYLYSDGDNG